jgi:hypothetical protein
MVLPSGIEPPTSPLPRECSTTELRQRPRNRVGSYNKKPPMSRDFDPCLVPRCAGYILHQHTAGLNTLDVPARRKQFNKIFELLHRGLFTAKYPIFLLFRIIAYPKHSTLLCFFCFFKQRTNSICLSFWHWQT